jgi:hypothetical protein
MLVGLIVVVAFVLSCGASKCKKCAELQQGPFFFLQKVDHFGSVRGTFEQKYFVVPGTSSGPYFLYISGEAPLDGFENDQVLRYATSVGATVLTLEHRYYGEGIIRSEGYFAQKKWQEARFPWEATFRSQTFAC